jgi:tetratricopeptide (TPR) repeat protein
VIGLFIKIPFHAQLKVADPRVAEELTGIVGDIVNAFAASMQATEESFLLTFDESSRPCRLRAAEAARCLASKLAGLGSRLHGWAILLDSGAESDDEALRVAARMWYGVQSDGLFVSTRSKSYFVDYFLFGPKGAGTDGSRNAGEEDCGCVAVLDAVYARPILPLADLIEEAPKPVVDKLVDLLGEFGVGQDAEAGLALLGPGRGPFLCLDAALAKLYPDSAGRFLRLRASTVEGSPYGPIAWALDRLTSARARGPGLGSLISGAERGLLEELASTLDFLLRSPYRRDYSPQIDTRIRICAAAALRYYARAMRAAGLPPFIILEGVDIFPRRSLALILGLFGEGLAEEGIRILALGAALPEHWDGAPPRRLELPGPGPEAVAQAARKAAEAMCSPDVAASLALAAAGDALRLKLALRLLCSDKSISPAASTEALAVEALATFPREYAELLLALKLCEETLTDECAESFLVDSGYVSGVRAPIYEALSVLGFITREARPRIASEAAARRVEKALPDRGKAARGDFVARLLKLREEGRLLSSTAFFKRLVAEAERGGVEGVADSALVVDCIAEDAIYGPSDRKSAGRLDHHLEPLAEFLSSYAASDRIGSADALERLEAAASESEVKDALSKNIVALARAAFEYAEGKSSEAASLAKEALMGLHTFGSPKAEARAHRILGLCSLAQEQVQEGADYLSNAYDIAEAAPEPLECILSAISEAAADFTLGDLGRALSKARAAADWALKSFRADWESAAYFIEGRANIEIGRYEAAAECFGRVRAVARVYGQAEAARRAEIWTGRAASLEGSGSRAREILERSDDDAEALWFLAEELLRNGEHEKAASVAARALETEPRPGFSSADAFDWSTGFASLEGRAVGFLSGRSFLRDQIEAFVEFASGMTLPAEEALARADHLASMAREDRIAALHPSAHIYLFYRYLILERAMPSSMDGATALSKAFKALQLRSMHVGEAAFKDGFLESNRWNRALVEAAKSRKLI